MKDGPLKKAKRWKNTARGENPPKAKKAEAKEERQ